MAAYDHGVGCHVKIGRRELLRGVWGIGGGGLDGVLSSPISNF